MLKRLGMTETLHEPGPAGVSRWLALNRAKALAPIIHEIQSAGMVAQIQIVLELNARGVPTPRGGKWHKTSVNRLLHRLESPGARPDPPRASKHQVSGLASRKSLYQQ